MSYLSISMSIRDQALRHRILTCAVQQAWYNPTLSTTDFGKILKTSPERAEDIIPAVCCAPDVEAAYAMALDNDVQNPGGNETVVTDPMIFAIIQARWPMGPMT